METTTHVRTIPIRAGHDRRHRVLLASLLSLAIAGLLATAAPSSLSPLAAAHAQEGHEGGHGGSGQEGGHDDDHDSGHDQDAGGTQGGGDRGKGRRGASARGESDSGSHSVESRILREDVGPDEEDSDRRGPQYGGGRDATGKPPGAGSKKGDLYGDLYVILRDDNGVPILDANGNVQPVDAEGNLIPIDEEGEVQSGYEALLQEVEFGRLSVGRSPDRVTDKSYDEALATINEATAIRIDEAGRIVVTIDGVEKTIDSPLENLALYVTLMENGHLPGLDLQDGVSLGSLSFLADPAFTSEDMMMAATLLAAASDKAGTITLDTVVYMSSILGVDGIEPIVGPDGKTYVDYSTAAYDRSDTYSGDVTYLKSNGDGTYTQVTEPIMVAVFGGEDYSGTLAEAFAQAADDARAVISFIHDTGLPTE